MPKRSTPRFAIILAVLAVLPSSTRAQEFFEGQFTMKFTADGETGEMRSWIKGSKMRQEFTAEGNEAAMIIDAAAGSVIMIDHSGKQYMDMSEMLGLRDMMKKTETEPPPAMRPTGRKDSAAGHSCEYYAATVDGQEIEMCIATDLGFFGGTIRPGMGQGGLDDAWMAAWRKQFPNGFFPLKMKANDDGDVMTVEVTSVRRGPVPDSQFQPPEGYKPVRIGG